VNISIYDSHAHLISSDRERYPPSMADDVPVDVFDNPMTAERLLGEMDRNGVDHALLVQRGTVYGFDNSYVCDSARLYPGRLRAVCAIDARQPDCGKTARRWVEEGAVGLRVMEPVRGGDLSWLQGEAAEGVWRVAEVLGLPLCVHLFPWNRSQGLAAIDAGMAAHPDLAVVIDHFSNLPIDPSGQPQIDDALRRVAARPNAVLKFTTIPLGRLARDGIEAGPLVTSMAGLFGPDRLIWGSDVAQSAGTYAKMVALGRAAVRHLAPPEQAAILDGNTRRVYRL
jgi:predicted TIM-barrel fold metal-dependent hydrolase